MNNTELIGFRSLPNELIRAILFRISFKSLCRLRCVSKFFQSAISNECFLTFRYAVSSTDRDETGGIYFWHYPRVPIHNIRHFVFRPNDETISNLPVLVNGQPPFTRVWRHAQCGYDSISNQHKVLLTMFTNDPVKEASVYSSYVFVEGSVSWRRIQDSPLHYPYTEFYVCINGIIYYKAWTSVKNRQNDFVVAFSLGLETFRFIPFPSVGHSRQSLGYRLMGFDGHLVLVNSPGQYNVDMWLLEDSLSPTWIQKSFMPSDKDF